jgi:hypothetical protein
MATDKTKKGFGAVIDPRPEEEKALDYRLEELVTSTAPVKWTVKKDWRKFPIFDQNGSGSCVAQTVAKMMGVMYWLLNSVYVHFSATHVYTRRSNKPSGGMIGVDSAIIAQNGVTLEDLVPSQKMTDKQMDAIKIEKYKEDVGSVFKVGKYIQPAVANIETIASIIQQTGKPVMVWYYFNNPEWTTIPEIKGNVDLYGANTARHSITAVDFTLLGKEHTSDKKLWGKKALIIEDSWGSRYGANGQRFITEDFHNARNWFALYFMNFKFEEGTPDITRPKYTFVKDMFFDPKAPVTYGDPEVIALQNVLKFEGLFPSNVESTGYFGSVTRKAVSDFQVKYGITPIEGYVGSKTRAKLNELYRA